MLELIYVRQSCYVSSGPDNKPVMKSGLVNVFSDYEITKESLTSHLSMTNDSSRHLRPRQYHAALSAYAHSTGELG